jgi:serine/threonine-protein kinase
MNAPDYFDLGESYCSQGQLDEAIAAFTHALHVDPLFLDALVKRCWAYLHTGDYQQAIADATAGLILSPENPYLLNHRGIGHFKTKEHQRAIEDYSAALAADPEFVMAYYNRGNVYLHLKDWSRAIEDYSKALQRVPSFLLAVQNRARCYLATRQYELAIRDLKVVIEEDEDNATTYNRLAWLLATCPVERLRDGRRAVEYALRACELSGWTKAYMVDTLAAACAEVGNFEDAIKWQRNAMALLKKHNQGCKDRLETYQKGKPVRDSDQ